MKTTLSVYDFRDAFTRAGRKDQFSYDALGLIYDYLEEIVLISDRRSRVSRDGEPFVRDDDRVLFLILASPQGFEGNITLPPTSYPKQFWHEPVYLQVPQ